MDLLEFPVTLVVKAPNQQIADTKIECDQGWTIKMLKEHLSDVYPSKPNENQQKIIYSGKLLQDDVVLKDVLRQYNPDQTYHTVHLVCAPSEANPGVQQVQSSSCPAPVQPSSSQTSPSPAAQSPPSQSSSSSPVSPSNINEGLRQRHIPSSSTSSSSSSSSVPSSSPSSPPNTAPTPHVAPITTATPAPDMQQIYGGVNAADQLYMNNMYQMMAGGPAMMAPGLYSPEQMLWLQQMYTQQMANYMQYMQQGYQAEAPADAAAPPADTTPAAHPNDANNAQANQRAANNRPEEVRMNAQGGPVLDDDDEDGNRDWLDWVYTLSRFGVLISIVYFYSTISRFVVVFGFFFMVYAYQAGWLRVRRRNEQQEQRQEQQQEQQEQQEQQPEAQPDQEQQQQQQQPAEGEADAEGTDESTSTEEPAVAAEEPAPSKLRVIWSFCSTFVTSLVPQQPAAVNAN